MADPAAVNQGENIAADDTTPTAETRSFFSQLLPHAAVILSSFFCALLIGLNDGALGTNIPRLKVYYNLQTSTISIIFLLQTLGYLTSAFSNGYLVHRIRQECTLFLGGALYVAAFALISVPLPFPAMAVAMYILGFGVGLEEAGLNTVIAELPISQLSITVVLNLFHACWGIGSLIGPLVATALLARGIQWNFTYVIWAGIAILNFAGFLLAFWSRFRLRRKVPRARTSGLNMLATALRLRTVWFGAVFLLLYVGVEQIFGSWIYTFLTQYRHGDPVAMGTVNSIYWIGLTSGRLFLGWVTSRGGERRMIALYCVLTIAGIVCVWRLDSITLDAVFLFFLGLVLGPLFPTTIAVVSRMVPLRILPTAIGFLSSFGSMGSALFPFMAGNMAEALGIQAMMPLELSMAIALFVCWLLLWRFPSVIQPEVDEVEVKQEGTVVEEAEGVEEKR